jgi:hypothetical protein
VKRPEFLAFVRQLPCIICHAEEDHADIVIHAAHIRYASAIHGKGITGIGRKPDDRWCLPLCSFHHVMGGSEAQHNNGERKWWAEHHIDPFVSAALLFSHFSEGDSAAARAVVLFADTISQGAA